MESSPLKRPTPLHEKQPDEKRSKLSKRENMSLFLNDKISDQMLSNVSHKVPCLISCIRQTDWRCFKWFCVASLRDFFRNHSVLLRHVVGVSSVEG